MLCLSPVVIINQVNSGLNCPKVLVYKESLKTVGVGCKAYIAFSRWLL